MSNKEADEVDKLPFNWGKKGRVGGKKKEVQFYKSFTYDGVNYNLHDCVYMYKEGEPGPYVGKLIKIWENADKTRKVKVQWFFQPYEIVNWLGNEEFRDNELFLASGEGVGLANVNPLEAIAGKCTVVCISKDSRNRHPSAKELEDADYVFYRTFDVGKCSISDMLDDKVGGLEVKYVFNEEGSEQPSDTPGLGSIKKEEAGVCNAAPEVLGKSSSAIVEVEGGSSHLALKGSENVKGPVVKSKYSPRGDSVSGDLNEVATSSGRLETIPVEIASRNEDSQQDARVKEGADAVKLKSSPKGKSAFGATEDSDRVIKTNGRQAPVSGDKIKRSRAESHMDDAKGSKVGSDRLHLEEPIKHVKESDPSGNKPSKKSVVEDSVKPLVNKNTDCSQKIVHGNNTKASTVVSYEKKVKSEPRKDSLGSDKGVRSTKNMAPPEERPSKKARVENCVKSNENEVSIGVQKCSTSAAGNNARDSTSMLNSTEIDVTTVEKSKSKVTPVKLENESKQKIDEKKSNISNSQLPKVESKQKIDEKKSSISNSQLPKVDSKQKIDEKKSNISNSQLPKVESKQKIDEKKSSISNSQLPKVDSKQKIDEKKSNISNSQLSKVAGGRSPIADRKSGDIFEVVRRPDDAKSRFFREKPWEEKLKTAHEEEKLVLLSNLDPEYSSGDIEDIIWTALNEACEAKRVQCSAISSPHSGQAFIILRNKAAAEKVVQELADGCLLLPNGRPLVGSSAPPFNFPGKQSTFFGHLMIEKLKNQNSKEKEAVSTSHCSQPNTIENEMAMEWCLLQLRADDCWKSLYKNQGQELKKLQSNLKKK